ncbi:SH3 domain-containing protein [Paenibacillus alvei]|uniref:SH3 domain-containing protein n=1 Tax=Paenibacillus alvei TaxID=44250 RepID=UPI00227E7952|nr:SH3 domain-containing protein [Paenibacillus alvei]
MNDYIVIKKHRSNYPNPLTLIKGQSVIMGEKYEGPENWENWIFCTTQSEGNQKISGWVPMQLLDTKGTEAIVLEDYTARELNVDEGDQLVGHRELNGWRWCTHRMNSEEGWVPEGNLQFADDYFL